MKNTRPLKHPSVLVEEYFKKPRISDRKESLGSIVGVILEGCVSLNEIHAYGISPAFLSKALNEKRINYASLVAIRRAVDLISEPIEAEDRLNLESSPFKSASIGDNVKEDAIYFLVITSLSLLEGIRANDPRSLGAVEADASISSRIDDITALRDRRVAPKDWANIISEIAMEGSFLCPPQALQEGGPIYEIIRESAVRNRKGKRVRAFERKFCMSPQSFLKRSDAEMLQVITSGGQEPLNFVQATRAKTRAEDIVQMQPTDAELRSRLKVLVLDRIKTVPRN